MEEKRIAARRKAAENRMASLLSYTKKCLELADRDEIQCDYEASKATAGTMNGFQAGFERGSLMRKHAALWGFI